MRRCLLTITTVADGKENEISREGEFALSLTEAKVAYREDAAFVSVGLKNGAVFVERQGDYTLRLILKKGETTTGELGINGSVGEIETYTRRIAYSLTETSFMLSLHYSLIMGGEVQDMRLRLFAKEI